MAAIPYRVPPAALLPRPSRRPARPARTLLISRRGLGPLRPAGSGAGRVGGRQAGSRPFRRRGGAVAGAAPQGPP